MNAKELRDLVNSLPKVPAIHRSPDVPTGQAFTIRGSLIYGPVARELEGAIFVSEADYRRIFEAKP